MKDRARAKTDKQLKTMERNMSRVYKSDPALIAIKRKYDKYMAYVDEQTHDAYVAYVKETDADKKAELKKAYMSEVEGLTSKSKEYRKLISEFTSVLAQVNQKALNIANIEMRKIYAENYNEVAVECRKVGIKVNGKA